MYFAGKALTDAHKGYVVIELESLAEAWAMKKFHHILYASHFVLETVQKLLEAILLEFESSNSMITADTDQNLYLPLYSKKYTWHYKSASTVLVPPRTDRYYQATKAAHSSDY